MSVSYRLEAFLTTLDTASHCLSCAGAAVKYLSHSFWRTCGPKATLPHFGTLHRRPRLRRPHLAHSFGEPGTLAVIPAQRKRGDTDYTPARHGHDVNRDGQRNAIERTFARLKQLRRFATRYDRRADCFFARFQLGAMLNLVENCSHALIRLWERASIYKANSKSIR